MPESSKYLTPKLLMFILLLVLSCGKENEEVFNGIFSKKGDLATITTTPASFITGTSAIAGGNLTDNGKTYIISCGLCWGANENPDTTDFKILTRNVTGEFTDTITGLLKGTTYFLRAFVTNNIGIAYGNQETFTTLNVPTITTAPVTSITESTAITGGNISSEGGSNVTACGICWSNKPNPTITDSIITRGTATGAFTCTIRGLSPNTTYTVKAFATNSIGTAYGSAITFSSSSPGATITDIDGNVYNTITIGTQIWLKENLKTTRYRDGTIIPNITDNTAWFTLTSGAYCWYNNNQATYKDTYGALYNNYTTIDSRNLCPSGWHVPTNEEWDILSGFLGGKAIAAGKLKETGTVHWTSPNYGATNESGFTALPGGYRVNNWYMNLAGSGGWWSSTETSSTEAYYRIMEYNSTDAIWGIAVKQNGYSVRCLKGEGQSVALFPSLSTTAVTSITATTVTCGGNIINDGGAAITSRGVCWSTNANPTITDSKTTDGSGAGTFSSNITGLSYATTYHIRAYATNSRGTAYGQDITFITYDVLPIVTTTAISAITSVSASSGGDATSPFGPLITERGVCWSTSPTPTTANSRTIDGSGSGAYSSSITGLSANTTYYVRAYATNSVGTKYGNEISFTSTGSVSDIDGNTYTIVKIGTQTWMVENLKTTKLNDGTTIPYITDAAKMVSMYTEGHSYYNYDISNNPVYGALYNWFSINTRKLCPLGWHVPSDDEWKSLEMYLGMTQAQSDAFGWRGTDQGTQLRNNTGWLDTGNGTNTSGFSALPGGITGDNGTIVVPIGWSGIWWSSTVANPSQAWVRSLAGNYTGVLRGMSSYQIVNSVRCLQGQPPALAIGDYYQGGIIAYIFQPGDPGYIAGQTHGLIAAPSDQSTGIKWFNASYTLTGATLNLLGSGNTNTNTIVEYQGDGSYAAKLCYDLVLGGYNDWYLPSMVELYKLYLSENIIGGFSDSVYWSSTEQTINNALPMNFLNGNSGFPYDKVNLASVRAVRIF